MKLAKRKFTLHKKVSFATEKRLIKSWFQAELMLIDSSIIDLNKIMAQDFDKYLNAIPSVFKEYNLQGNRIKFSQS